MKISRFLISIAAAILMLAAFSFAQDAPKHTVAVTGTYTRADFNIKNIQGETRSVDAERDSPGFNVTYTYRPVGALIVGMSTGASFENREINEVYSCGNGCVAVNGGTSKVAKAYFQYEMGVAKHTGRFQPGLVGVVGVDRSNFGGTSFGPNGNFVTLGKGSRFYYGAKGYVDIKIAKKAYIRTGLQAANAFNSDVSQLDVQGQLGLAFKF